MPRILETQAEELRTRHPRREEDRQFHHGDVVVIVMVAVFLIAFTRHRSQDSASRSGRTRDMISRTQDR